jgi:4'-phosphopantetheinyl transferase
MPVIFKDHDFNSEIAIWEITEPASNLLMILDCEDSSLLKFKFEEKKLQWLAAQILLKKICGSNLVYYDENGKPHLSGRSEYISLTNSKNLVGLAYSKTQNTGIDIQYHSPKIIRIVNRFINIDELSYIEKDLSNQMAYLHFIWCCKEAVFKVYGTRLAFKDQISILPFESEQNSEVTALVRRNHKIIRHKLKIGKIGDSYFAYIKQ